jgi:hypothetical protein
MERFFLALMVSGLLLAVAAASLFVATRPDDRSTAAVNLPSAPNTIIQRAKPRKDAQTGDRR